MLPTHVPAGKYKDDASGKKKLNSWSQRWKFASPTQKGMLLLCGLCTLTMMYIFLGGSTSRHMRTGPGFAEAGVMAESIVVGGSELTGGQPPPAFSEAEAPPHLNSEPDGPPPEEPNEPPPPVQKKKSSAKITKVAKKSKLQKIIAKIKHEEKIQNQEQLGTAATAAVVPPQQSVEMRQKQSAVVAAMKHAWKGYKDSAWGQDQLKPISKSSEQWFDLGLTLIDALDTLWLMDLHAEFKDARNWVATTLSFDKQVDVNLFETTIRVLGGLESTFALTGDKMFLNKAVDLADRLMVAFDTSSGVPLSDVNIGQRTAHGPQWSSSSSSSEVTTVQLEFKYLTHLTGNKRYREVVDRVMDVVDQNKPRDGLIPIWIDPNSGQFNGGRITLGARGDSYYEYLLKQWLLTGKKNDKLKNLYLQAIQSVDEQLIGLSKPNNLMFVAEREGGSKVPKMDHLVCFLSGTLALGAYNGLGGGLDGRHMYMAKELAKTCYKMYESMPTGLAPEIMMFNTNSDSKVDMYVKPADEHNLLRPETVESLFVLWRITGDPIYREWGWNIFTAFEKYTKIESGGYSSLNSVVRIPVDYRDKMESFFLGETLKYFYLLFSDDPKKCDLNKVVFNTEAHPLPIFQESS